MLPSYVCVCVYVGRNNLVVTATRYGLKVRESNKGDGEIFRIQPDRPWSSPNILCNGYRLSFPAVKRSGVSLTTPVQFSAEVKKDCIYTSAPPLDLIYICLGLVSGISLKRICNLISRGGLFSLRYSYHARLPLLSIN